MAGTQAIDMDAREDNDVLNPTWLVVLLVTFGTTMCAFEAQLTNLNLSYIVGTIGITPDEFTWIIAGFFAAQLVGIALIDRCLKALGLRNYLLTAMAAYVVFELIAANSNSVVPYALSRLGAGFINGSVTTASLILIMRKIPADRRLLLYFFFGAPAIFVVPFALIVGGTAIENFHWHQMYEMASVPGMALFLSFLYLVPGTGLRAHPFKRMDWIGLALLLWSAASYCLMMLRGTTENWFDSPFIQLLVASNLAAWCAFGYQQVRSQGEMINFRLFKEPHFFSIIALNFLFGFILCYTLVVIGFLVLTQDSNSIQIGSAVMWAGLCLPFVLAKFKRLDYRLLIFIGALFLCLSGLVNGNLTRLEDGNDLLLSQVLRSFGQTLFLWPLWNLTILEVERRNYADAAKMYTFSRALGMAAGIAAVGAIELWRENFHSTHIAETLTDSVFHARVAQMKAHFIAAGSSLPMAGKQALIATAKQIRAESLVLTFSDTFWLIGICVFIMLIPLFFVKPNTVKS